MRKSLLVALLLASGTLPQAHAQQVRQPRKTPQTAPTEATASAAATPPAHGTVYSQVEQMPTVPGEEGEAAIYRAIQHSFRYPAADLRNQVEGQATASFLVTADGTVTEAQIVQRLTPTVDAELLRVIQALPRLQPGRQNGQAVAVLLTVPLTLSLGSDMSAAAIRAGSRPAAASDPALFGEPGTRGAGTRPGELAAPDGWRFEALPQVEVLDQQRGSVRFRFQVTEAGQVEAVTKVAGTASAAQEQLCREALHRVRFVKLTAGAGRATGYYTFRLSPR